MPPGNVVCLNGRARPRSPPYASPSLRRCIPSGMTGPLKKGTGASASAPEWRLAIAGRSPAAAADARQRVPVRLAAANGRTGGRLLGLPD